MSSQLAAQLRILSGAGSNGNGGSKDRRSVVASSASLAAIHHATPGSTASKYKASFLFRADVAAATDSATIHSMGVSGMEQLLRLEPRLKAASAALFQAHSFDRDSHNQQQLQNIQTQINQCIRLLAPYFMIKPTHKVLEFLIRRYNIHIYNISALLSAFLPYHDSPLFARLTQILQIQLQVTPAATADTENNVNTHKLFGFLEAAQREGTASITRHTLVQRCLHDAAFLQWIIQLVSLKHVAHLSNTTITFYTSIILELLTIVRSSNNANNAAQADSIVHVIVMHSVEVLNAHATANQPAAAAAAAKATLAPAATMQNRELFFSTLLILAQISQIHQFNATLLDSIIFLLFKSLPAPRQDQTLLQPILLTLVSLCQNQSVSSIVPKALDSLLAATGDKDAAAVFVRALVVLSAQYDATPFLSLLLTQVAGAHAHGSTGHALLMELVGGGESSIQLTQQNVRVLVNTALQGYVAQYSSSGAKEWNVKSISPLRALFLVIQDRVPVMLEKVVQEILAKEQERQTNQDEQADDDDDDDEEEEKSASTKKKPKRSSSSSSPLLSLIHLLFEGSSQEILDLNTQKTLAQAANGPNAAMPQAGSILTCLNSPLSNVRIQAIQAVDALHAEGKAGSSSVSSHLKNALLARLQDSESNVIRALLKVNALTSILARSDLLAGLQRILARHAFQVDPEVMQRESRYRIIEQVFKVATKITTHIVEADADAAAQATELHQLFAAIGPFVFEHAFIRHDGGKKAAHAAHSLLAQLGAKQQRQVQTRDGENGFDLCLLFAGVASVDFPRGDQLDVDQMESYNRALSDAIVAAFVKAATSTSFATIESMIESILARTAATIAQATAASAGVTGLSRADTPTTAFVTIQIVNAALGQIAHKSGKKSPGIDGVFLRLVDSLRLALGRSWSALTSAERQLSSSAASAALPAPTVFLRPNANSNVNPFPAFVRATFAQLIQHMHDFAPVDHSDFASVLRGLFMFFLGDADAVSAFGPHIALLCKLHLNGGGIKETVEFIEPILRGSNGATIQVVVRSYHLLHALLSNQGSSKSRVASSLQPVLHDLVATFLVGIASPSRSIRHAAIMATQALAAVVDGPEKDGVSGATLKQLLVLVLKEKDEVLSAGNSSDIAGADALVETAADASLQYVQGFLHKSLSIESATSPFKSDARIGVHQFLMGIAVRVAEQSVHAAWRMMQLLKRLAPANVADITLPYLASLLEEPTKSTGSHADIVVELLQLVDVSVVQLAGAKAVDVLSRALVVSVDDSMEDVGSSTADRNAASIRRGALARITPPLFSLMTPAQQESIFDKLLATLKMTDGVAEVVAELKIDSAVFATRLVISEAPKASKKKKADATAAASAHPLAQVQSLLELLQLKDPQRTLVDPFALVATLFQLLDQLNGMRSVASDESANQQQAVEYAKQLTMAVLMRFISSQPNEVPVVVDVASKKGKKSAGAPSPAAVSVKDINVAAVVACLGANEPASEPVDASDANTALHTLNVSLENTRTHALNLLSAIGKRHPELIVGVLIPIFASLLQQSSGGDEKTAARNAVTNAMDIDADQGAEVAVVADADPYAFTLLNKLISTVLPSIIQAKLQWNVWQLLSVFVDALGAGKHGLGVSSKKKKGASDSAAATVAGRRRLKLFRNLVLSLQGGEESHAVGASNEENYLHVVLSLLVAKSVTDKATKKVSSSAALDFAHELAEQFADQPVFQVEAMNHLLRLLSKEIAAEHGALIEAGASQLGAKLRLAGSKKSNRTEVSPAGVDAGLPHLHGILRSSTQRSAWQRGVVSWISAHLARLSFAQQVYLFNQRQGRAAEARGEADATGDEEIQSSFLALFEHLFARLREAVMLSKQVDSTEGEDEALANHFLILSTQTNGALMHLNGLLTMDNFIRILQELFALSRVHDASGGRDLQLIIQALALLNSKLISYKDRQKVQGYASGKRKSSVDDDDDDAASDAMEVDHQIDPELAERRNFHKTRKQEQRLLISLLPALEQLLLVDPAALVTTHEKHDLASIKQSTLLNLEMLTSSFASFKQFQGEFVKVVSTVLNLTILPSEESERKDRLTSAAWQHISTSALLCLSTMIAAFHTRSAVLLLDQIPIMIPNTIDILKEINAAAPSKKAAVAKETKTKTNEKTSKKRKHAETTDSESDDEDETNSNQLQTLDTLPAPLLQLSALSVLQASIVSVPEFLSPYLGDLLKVLLYPGYHNSAAGSAASSIALAAAVSASSSASGAPAAAAASSVDHSSVSTVVGQSITSLITLVPSRTLLPYIFNHYKTASSQGYSSLRRLFNVLQSIVTEFKADNVKAHFKVIFKFFLAAAQQLRKRTGGGSLTNVSTAPDAYGVTLSDAEDALIRSFLELTLKLNETSFKGLFLKMLQWVGPIPNTSAAADTGADGPQTIHEFLSRSLVFFKLIEQFSSKLKGIFVTYFGYILDHCVVFLNAPKKETTKKSNKDAEEDVDMDAVEGEEDEAADSDDGPKAKKAKRDDTASGAAAVQSAAHKAVLNAGIAGGVSSELIDLVLHSLRNCFLHDHQHFLDKYHFQLLTTPMVNQIQYAFNTRATGPTAKKEHANQLFDEFITTTLAPTIVQMAVRMGNYLQWKPLVSALLVHGRSSSSAVRRASVYIFEQIFLVVGDNFLTVTPELLPWIAELLEDGDVGVEHAVQRLVKIIEKLSGESLEEALQG